MPSETLLIALLALPFAGACIAAWFPENARNAEAYLAGTVALVALLIVAMLYPQIAAGKVVQYTASWLPDLGLDFRIRVDGFAWIFAMLITAIGFLVVLYARYSMYAADPVPRFFAFLLAFMGAMLGIVLSGNLVQLVFFWELTSLFSFLLIGYRHQTTQARDGARMALVVTSFGGLCLFAGVLMLGHIAGGYDLDRVLAAGDVIRAHSLYVPTLVLILLGALMKSAQFPFHFWLPHAMAAPTPVSAYLHSATMVKAGVFLLIRIWPAMGGTWEWLWLVGTAGLITFVLAAFIAVFQQDLKGLLAYSTISHLGLITLLIGLDRPLGLVAAIFHIMNHATFKASLFMAAGIIERETGTRDIRQLNGLRRFMPITATLALVAAAAMAGVPLLNGFLSKEMFFAETIEIHDNSFIDRALPYIVTIASMFTVIYSLRFIRDVFFGASPQGLSRVPQEPPVLMRLPAELLVLVCLVVGVLPGITIGPILESAARSVLGAGLPAYSLVVWHGFTPPLLMSLVAICGGVAAYLMLRPYLRVCEGPPLLRHIKGQRIFDIILVAISWRLANRLESIFGTRRLQPQLQLLLCAALIAGAVPIALHGIERGALPLTQLDFGFAAIWAIGISCALAAAYQAKFHRLAALIFLGGAGLATCLSFIWISAPDLALTQLIVETVTIVLLLLGLRWLPKRFETADGDSSSMLRWYRVRDLTLALGIGGGMATIAYIVMTRPMPDTVSKFFVENAYLKGGGTNIVNVILVDFRSFDTLGEITVLGIVALTIYALLRRFRPAAESVPVPEQQHEQDLYDEKHPGREIGDTLKGAMAIPALVTRLLFPVIAATAFYLLLRGHDLPGGGFVAGITMAVAFILQYMSHGTTWVENHLRVLPVRWMGSGLLLAGIVGLVATMFGQPFLTSSFSYLEIPLIGAVPMASAFLLDIGVFALVLGATVLMLIAIAHQSVRAPRSPRGREAEISEATSTAKAK